MHIQQFGQFKYSADFKNFYYEGKEFGPGIGFLSMFFHNDFRTIRKNLENDMQEFFVKSQSITFYETTVMNDAENNLIYIGVEPNFEEENSEIYDAFIADKSEKEIADIQPLEFFKHNIWENMHLSRDNFFDLLRSWNNFLTEKTPCVLLYQDDTNKFNVMPFQSGKEMGTFIISHTKSL